MASNTNIETFYREHSSAVLGFLISLTRDRALAEDLMQDTYVKATRALGSYRGGSPRAWLFAIARSTFIDHTRKRADIAVDVVEAPVFDDVRLDERAAITSVLARLPERQRSALLLSDHVGMSAAEVGESMGVSPGAARVLVHRARQQFKTIYEREEQS